MKNVKIFAGVLVIVVVIVAVIEFNARSRLKSQLREARSDTKEKTVEAVQPATPPKAAADDRSTKEELTKTRAQIALLQTRPKGVVETAFRAPTNAGRATPAAAAETFVNAVTRGDVEEVSRFIKFSDSSPSARAAFMANFSEGVRNRYDTPEKLCAAALYALDYHRDHPDPGMQMQVINTEGNGAPDKMKVSVWLRTGSGQEAPQNESYQQWSDGWSLKPLSLTNAALLKTVRERLDPTTGNFIAPRKQ